METESQSTPPLDDRPSKKTWEVRERGICQRRVKVNSEKEIMIWILIILSVRVCGTSRWSDPVKSTLRAGREKDLNCRQKFRNHQHTDDHQNLEVA